MFGDKCIGVEMGSGARDERRRVRQVEGSFLAGMRVDPPSTRDVQYVTPS